MRKITKKGEVNLAVQTSFEAYKNQGLEGCIATINNTLLTNKVKFPLLEFAAHSLFENIPDKEQIELCNQIANLQTEGGNVLLGIILQNRLANHFDQSFQKAAEYIAQGEIWYVCDIIGERVFGFALLTQPEKTLPEFQKLAKHPAHWVVRAMGAGGHYAIKKGLQAQYAQNLFKLLLSLANSSEKEIRQGIGWAAKTTAKFHPEIIGNFQKEIQDETNVANWFRRKIKIGLDRHQYAPKK